MSFESLARAPARRSVRPSPNRPLPGIQGLPKRHGLRNSPEYGVWVNMLARCFNKKHRSFCYYGGRGICVCPRWQESFDAFVLDMGRRPSPAHSLDRVDNDGNYEPGNTRWATRSQQQRNRRSRPIVEFRGERLTIAEWSERFGIRNRTLIGRFANGWSAERALLTPVAANARKPGAKLAPGDVIEIYRATLRREPHRTIAARYGVDPSLVSQIRRKKVWADVLSEVSP